MRYESFSQEDTFRIGYEAGKLAKKGQFYCLIGDLGVGKTVFTKGFAQGLGIIEDITSPTFTIVNVYDTGRLPFYHFDVYRIEDLYEMEEIGYEEYFYGEGVSFVEWGNLIRELFPKEFVEITIKKELERGFDYRIIEVKEFHNENTRN